VVGAACLLREEVDVVATGDDAAIGRGVARRTSHMGQLLHIPRQIVQAEELGRTITIVREQQQVVAMQTEGHGPPVVQQAIDHFAGPEVAHQQGSLG
jgi:hypothetical protein